MHRASREATFTAAHPTESQPHRKDSVPCPTTKRTNHVCKLQEATCDSARNAPKDHHTHSFTHVSMHTTTNKVGCKCCCIASVEPDALFSCKRHAKRSFYSVPPSYDRLVLRLRKKCLPKYHLRQNLPSHQPGPLRICPLATFQRQWRTNDRNKPVQGAVTIQ